jgi:hypothetical protein
MLEFCVYLWQTLQKRFRRLGMTASSSTPQWEKQDRHGVVDSPLAAGLNNWGWKMSHGDPEIGKWWIYRFNYNVSKSLCLSLLWNYSLWWLIFPSCWEPWHYWSVCSFWILGTVTVNHIPSSILTQVKLGYLTLQSFTEKRIRIFPLIVQS